MAAAVPPQAAPLTRRRWRWARRGFFTLLLILLLIALFHRPLGHWAIQHFGRSALAKAGITGEWKTSGNLLGGLAIDDLKMTGNAESQVRSITLQHAAFDYDLMGLRQGGPGTMLKSIVVQNLVAELDLTRPGPPPNSASPAKPKTPPKLPSVILPAVRIENLTLKIQLPHDQLVIRQFSLLLDPAKPGLISADELDLPGTVPLLGLRGTTLLTPTALTLAQVSLWPEMALEKLRVDLTSLAKESASFEIVARQGPTRAELSGQSGAWFSSPTVDARLKVEKISHDTLSFWGVPAGSTQWRANDLELLAKGPVLRPDQLDLQLAASGATFQMPGVKLTDITLAAHATAGQFSLQQLDIEAGGNSAKLTGQAALSQTWPEIAKVPGSLDMTFNAPLLAELLPPEADVRGAVSGKARVGFSKGKLTDTNAEISAVDLRLKGVPIESIRSRARLENDSDTVILEKTEVTLNAKNKLALDGQLQLTGEKNLSVRWQAAADDLATLPAEVRPEFIWPTAGRVQSEGAAAGSLTQWQAKQWDSLNAQVSLKANGLRVKDASLEAIILQANATAGEVRIAEAKVQLDETNFLTLTGGMDLTNPALPVDADLQLQLPDLSRASPWSTQFRGPALLAGAVVVDWKGSGEIKHHQSNSAGRLSAKGVKIAGMPEVLGLAADVAQSGSEVRVTGLKASAGPWRAEGSAFYDGWHLTVPELLAFLKTERIVQASARVPVRASGLVPNSPLSLRWKVDQLNLSKLAKALGQTLPVQGLLTMQGDFTGTMETLAGEAKTVITGLQATRATGPKTEPAEVKLTTAIQQGKLTLDGTVRQRPLQLLTLSATLPLDLPALLKEPKKFKDLPVSAQVRLPASSLAFLPQWVPVLRSVSGTAAVDFSVAGTVSRPVWKGSANLAVAEAEFSARSLPSVKDVVVKLRVDERRLTVDEMSVVLAGGRLQVTGGAGLTNPKDPDLDFKIKAEEVLVVRDDNLSLRTDADLTLRGPLSAALAQGRVDLVRGRVFKEIEFLPLSLPNDLPPPPPPTALSKSGGPSLPAPLDKWKFNIAIKTRDPIRLMGNVAKGNAVADLRFSGIGAKPVLTGKVKLEQMWLKLPFSRLNITRGEIIFTELQPFDPQIDIIGESNTGDRFVQVFVQGRALDPKVRLTSSPPLPEGEIASLLATGVTTSDLGSKGDEAAGRAAFVLLKQTYRKLFRKDLLETDDEEPPRLTFDFSVFGSDPARRGVSAIYEVSPKWRVIGKVGESGSFRGLLYYLIRFR